ncbi:hypothetical protein GCM10020360_15010 [Nonlabens tegetincola]
MLNEHIIGKKWIKGTDMHAEGTCFAGHGASYRAGTDNPEPGARNLSPDELRPLHLARKRTVVTSKTSAAQHLFSLRNAFQAHSHNGDHVLGDRIGVAPGRVDDANAAPSSVLQIDIVGACTVPAQYA